MDKITQTHPLSPSIKYKDDIPHQIWSSVDTVGYLTTRKSDNKHPSIVIEEVSLKNRNIKTVKELSIEGTLSSLKKQSKLEEVTDALTKAENDNPDNLYDLLFSALEALNEEDSINIDYFLELIVDKSDNAIVTVQNILLLTDKGSEMALCSLIRQAVTNSNNKFYEE